MNFMGFVDGIKLVGARKTNLVSLFMSNGANAICSFDVKTSIEINLEKRRKSDSSKLKSSTQVLCYRIVG